jgi:hypothetical protein
MEGEEDVDEGFGNISNHMTKVISISAYSLVCIYATAMSLGHYCYYIRVVTMK